MKRCGVCKQLKAPSEFYRLTRSRDGLQYRCKPCQNEGVRRYKRRLSTLPA